MRRKHAVENTKQCFHCNFDPFVLFAARQKEMAVSSITELVLAVKNPFSFSESTNRPTMRKSESAVHQMHMENIERMNNANPKFSTPDRRKSSSRLSAVFEVGKKRRKSSVLSFMRYVRAQLLSWRFVRIFWYFFTI